ncbi:hypothetical protein V5T82_16365 [Magnetovibrio sp. PR-2]|uniref:hypothetical protein n=1 Tax=Magnetovibrio sp. PR-2 TaxID=3120356 RepID=UPI002FCE4261
MAGKVVRRESGIHSYLMGFLSYMGILCLVPLIMNRKDEFIFFHAKQGLVIWMWSVLAVMALYVPGVGKLVFSMSAMAVVVASAVGILSVLLSRAWKLPFIHGISTKI